VCTTLTWGYCVTSSLPHHHVVPQLVYKHSDQFTDKMSDSDEGFDILRDINPYNFKPLVKKVTDSINYEAFAAATAYVDPEQPPVPLIPGPGSQQEVCLFVLVYV